MTRFNVVTIGKGNEEILNKIGKLLSETTDPKENAVKQIKEILGADDLGEFEELFDSSIEREISYDFDSEEGYYTCLKYVNNVGVYFAERGNIVTKKQETEIAQIVYDYHDFNLTIQKIAELV
jgi:protein-arginine kinase